MAEGVEQLELGNYRVIKSQANALGQGSYGKVWKAEHVNRKDIYAAVKEIVITDRLLPYVERETRLLQECDHRNIIKLFDVKREPTRTFICMEYCVDGNINSFVRWMKLTDRMCLGFIADVAGGLKYLHQRTPHILHRDLKPENVLVDRDKDQGNVILKLADFGLAKEFPNQSAAVAATGNVGTLFWMAPEMCISTGEEICTYNRPADVFSFGLFILSLLTHQQGRDLTAHKGICCI